MEDILQAITSVRPPLRMCSISKESDKACGFHLSRTQWDPYPWISNVDGESPAAEAGLTVGDFVIEVNGEDILGLKIDQVAQKVRLKSDAVRLLVWKAAVGDSETENKLPAVFNLQKFSGFLQSVLQLLECPVCLEVASSLTYQCANGHILCGSCASRTTKCPICRVQLSGRGRCLVVEKLHRLLQRTLSVKNDSAISDKKASPKVKESVTPAISDEHPVEPTVFHCPWNGPCAEKLITEQAVLPHLLKTHEGPCIQYNMRNDSVSVNWSQHPSAVFITRQDVVYFLRRLSSKALSLSVLGDSQKATHSTFSISPSNSSIFYAVTHLTDSAATILVKGQYFIIPKSASVLTITICDVITKSD